ncbi:MAG: SH3 domain-containing protein [Anaerocolumna sp.]
MKKFLLYNCKYCKYICVVMCFVLFCSLFYGTNFASVEAATTTGTVTATSLNVRTGPGTSYSKLQVNNSDVFIKKGEKVTIISSKSGWYKISLTYSGKKVEGYVIDDYIELSKTTTTPTPISTPTPTPGATTDIKPSFSFSATVTATSLNVRKEATTSSTRLGSVTKNQSVKVLNEVMVEKDKWYRILYTKSNSTYTGYVLSDYIKLALKPYILGNVNQVSGVKLYKKASTTSGYMVYKVSKKVISLKHKRALMLMSETTDSKGVKWFKLYVTISGVRYTGYLPANQVTLKKSAGTTTVTPTPTEEPVITIAPTVTPTVTPTEAVTPTPTPYGYVPDITTSTEGKVQNTSQINVFADVLDNNFEILYDTSYNPIYLTASEKVIVSNTYTINGYKWYYITFKKGTSTGYGYVTAEYIGIGTGGFEDQNTVIFQNLKGGTGTPTPTPTTGGILDDAEFENYLTSQGFPESYKPYLRTLHKTYPNWVFEAYHTGIDWNTAIARESVLGINLITNGKSVEWKSLEKGAYDWSTDKFIAFDGQTWVTPSTQGLMYFMDPRNFLTEKGIFQFETLTYKGQYQNASGVENILYNTPFYNKSFTYKNDAGATITSTFGDAFLAAATYSGVSPYHLATRSKQEVVTGTTTASSSVSGTFAGYEGYYNFYNIGAYHSTSPGGAIANALKYAKNGTSNATLNATYLIPWDNPYDAIVGGGYIIGVNYIKRGQDTIYLQKFNMTSNSTFSHQYMANIEAPNAEAAKTYTAYSGILTSAPIAFSIPVYLNMPAKAVSAPTKAYNPNNWLKTLSIDGYSLTPTFDLKKDQMYSVIVPNTVETINIKGSTVSSKASVMGTGTFTINTGNNIINIYVTAENGDIRTYQISVFKES